MQLCDEIGVDVEDVAWRLGKRGQFGDQIERCGGYTLSDGSVILELFYW